MPAPWKKIWTALELAGTRTVRLRATLIVVATLGWPSAYIVSELLGLSYAWAIFVGVLFGFCMGMLAGRVWVKKKEP